MNFMKITDGIPVSSAKILKILSDGVQVDKPIIGESMHIIGVNSTWLSTPVVAIQEQLDLGLYDE